MKLRCPKCQHKLSVPDKYAGRGVRCPKCNKAFNVPKIREGVGVGTLNLEDLAALETQSEELDAKELAEAEAVSRAQADAQRRAAATGPVRTCPNCNKHTPVKDPYVEILCSHCWTPIPALIKGSDAPRPPVEVGQTRRATRSGGFYAELASCLGYPLPILSSVATAAVIALAAGIVPLAVMTGLTYVMEQGNAGVGQPAQKADLSNLSLMVMGIFAFEVFLFSAIAMHAFIDVIKTTSIGTEKPPALSWLPEHWGKSFGGYVILVAYFAVMIYALLTLTLPEGPRALLASRDVASVFRQGGSGLVLGLVVICFGIPMNLLGMALGKISQALNPVNVLVSIGRTHVHYVFLVLILAVYGIFFGGSFWAIIHDWFLPQIDLMARGSKEGDLVQVAIALAVWGVVMAFYFYFMYVLGRLHGLFARSFRRDLMFGTL